MKKLLLLLASVALLVVGCAKDQLSSNGAGDGMTKVTFTASLDSGVATKAVADGDGAAASVNRCIMEIYYGGELFAREYAPVNEQKKATFTAQVVSNRTYTVAFWADKVDATTEAGLQVDKYYTTNATGGLQAITIKGDYVGNDDARDAFFYVGNDFTVAQTGTSWNDIKLKRPFAQMNVITTDWDKVTTVAALKPEKVNVTLKNALVKFNAVTGEASGSQDLNYEADVYTPAASGTNSEIKTLSMDYLFASTTKEFIDIDWKAKKTGDADVEHAFAAVPYQRNYRTNIKGALLTTQGQWTVTVDPDWTTPEYDVPFLSASTIAEAQSYIAPSTEGTQTSKVVDLSKATITTEDITGADKKIEFRLKTTSPADMVNFTLPAIPAEVISAGCTGWKITCDEGYPTDNVNVTAPTGTNVIIQAPTSHVVLNGQTYGDIDAHTGYGTLVVPKDVTVDKLTVTKGWVEIHGTVNTLNDIVPATGESVYFRDCEGLSQEVFNQIKGEDFSYIHPSYVERQNGDKWDIVPSENPGDGSRKVSLAGSPFKAGDVIKISNGVAEPVDCTVEEDEQGNILFKTNLRGSLTAVYPASAAKLNGNLIEGVNIPAAQSGKLADARIYKATVSAGGTKATFENQTSILKFYVDATVGVKSVSVTGTEDLASGGAKTVTVGPSGEQTIDNVTDDPAKRICYVAVLPGTKSSLTYSSETTTQGSVSKTLSTGATLVAGTEYEAFLPYYIDLDAAGLWGYCNVGAFLPEEPGRYFAWADVEGQTWNGSSWSGGGFSTPPTFDGEQGTLPPAKDAANVAWGGKWTLPAKAQIDALNGLGEALVWDDAKKGYVVSSKLFLPAAGGGGGTQFGGLGETGAYWSSSYGQFMNQQSVTTGYYALYILGGNNIAVGHSVNPVGISVRPVMASPLTQVTLNKESITDLEVGGSETLTCMLNPVVASVKSISWTSSNTAAATVDQNGVVTGVSAGTATITVTVKDQYDKQKTATCSVTVKKVIPAGAIGGEFSISATKKVHFSKGNLVATINASGAPTAWKFAANQYDCLGEGGANKTIGESAGDFDLFCWSTERTTYGINKSKSYFVYYGDFVDWGKAYCEKNNITPDNTWRTLSRDEWTYLFNTRTGAASKVGYATVGGVHGIIILPDNFTDPMKNNGSGAFVPKSSKGWDKNVYSGINWNAMETAGAVFLPAAGSRDGSDVKSAGGFGNYWSSTPRLIDYAYNVNFTSSGGVNLVEDGVRSYGLSVRLITECQ